MIVFQIPFYLRNVRHKPMWTFLLLLLIVCVFLGKTSANGETESPPTTTLEPDAAPGCRAPDIRFTVIKPETTTQQPYAKFETTPSFATDHLTTADVEFVEKINIDLTSHNANHQMGGIVNPYQINMNEHHASAAGLHAADLIDEDHDDDEDEETDETAGMDEATRKRYNQNRKMNKNRRSGSGRRRRIENENGQTRGRGSRYKRQVIHHDPYASADTDKWSGSKLAAEGNVYYIHIDDILKTQSPNEELKLKLYKLKQKNKNGTCTETDKEQCKKSYDLKVKKVTAVQEKGKTEQIHQLNKSTINYRQREDDHGSNINDDRQQSREKRYTLSMNPQDIKEKTGSVINNNERNIVPPLEHTKEVEDAYAQLYPNKKDNNNNNTNNDDDLQRVKRKSGKTTGALSRPKGGGDSSSKTTSRKDKGGFDDESGYSPVHPDEVESEEDEEEEEEVDIQQQFTEVSEIRFPGEIGPLGDRRLCKIRCIKGKWVGPLCATNEEDENGNVKFQPLYKSCHVQRIPPYLLLSYRNISVTPIYRSRRNRTSKSNLISNTQINIGWDVPHGHSLQARCKDLGMYKLLGESRVLCSNGLWAPRMPSCVPTTLLTNFSDDSAPSIKYRISNGSASFEPSGVLAVLPHSTILFDCIYPKSRGIPEWTWTSWYMQYPTGWAHEERYRLTIKNIENTDSGTFTCTSPRGLTNSVAVAVATSICPQLSEPVPPLTLRLEGNKLGQRAMYRCPSGYRVDGVANSTCLASGNWSSPPPTCQAVQCPRLILDDPHLSLVELNTSAWGRAVFKCQWGFKLTGPPGLECDPTGAWSGPVPRCRAIQCPTPVAPLNGRIGGTNLNQRRLTVGALITFSCNEGHTLVGEPSIICTESGLWSHPSPFCKSQCPYPGDPPNGLIAPLKFHYESGDYISVQCRPGYVQYSENGPPERPKCQPDGNWSGPVPKCRSYEEV